MTNRGPARPGPLLLLLSLLLAGCTVSFDPGLRGKGRSDPNGHPDTPGANAPPGTVPGGAPGRPPMFNMPPGGPGLPNSPADQTSLLLERLQRIEDDRKLMNARLAQLETQLREKDQAVTQANYEVQATTQQMRKSRDELQQWKAEVSELRGKIRAVEQENRNTVEVLMKALEQFIEKGSTRARP